MIYLFLVIILYIPIMKGMEPSESLSKQQQRTSSSLKVKIDVDNPSDEKGVLGLFHHRKGSLKDTEMRMESYQMLKDLSPIRAVDADIFKLHGALARLEADKKEIILELLKELKGTAKVPTFKERLKEFPWILDPSDTRIYRFLLAAYEARGYPRTNEFLDSCMSTLSSFHTSASPTPTFMSTAPVSQFAYPEKEENIQQIQNQQLQMQQNQQVQTQMMQQLSTQLWTLTLKQVAEKAADDKSAADGFSLKDFIDPKKIIKNSLIVGLVALLSVGNSAVSYILGGQSSRE